MTGVDCKHFDSLSVALKKANVTTPSLVIDKNHLDHNLDYLAQHLPDGADFRLVAKSLPSPELIDYCCQRLKTNRLMTFSLPMLMQIAAQHNQYQQMLGKPLPVEAARQFLEKFRPDSEQAQNILWLVDTDTRLKEYEHLANTLKARLNIVLELDVGLRRGGFRQEQELQHALQIISQSSNLNLSGLMGYDPHVPKIPTIFNMQKREQKKVAERYQKSVSMVSEILGEEVADHIIKNGAGSPTIHNYSDTDIITEFAAGSVLVKPSDFDLPKLQSYKPAAYIATPALKVIDKPEAPGLESLSRVLRLTGTLPEKSVFLYGGKWMANPVYPENLKYYSLMGRSSNQEALRGDANLNLKPDDFVFLRPTQSEFVLLQFGKILVHNEGEITDHWSVYPVHG